MVIQRLTDESQARQPGAIKAQELESPVPSGDAAPPPIATPPGPAGPKE
jgi:hypothetical protein